MSYQEIFYDNPLKASLSVYTDALGKWAYIIPIVTFVIMFALMEKTLKNVVEAVVVVVILVLGIMYFL